MGMTHTPTTLLQAVNFFKNGQNCHDFMVSRRWPDGVVRCPRCGSDSVYYVESRKGWECKTKHPKRTFTLKTGTIFEDSALGLDKWLPCVWLIANAKNGISSHEIARALGVTQKTAWFMLQRIRLAMQDDSNGDGGKLGGEVEVDETFIGGKARNMHASKRKQLIASFPAKRKYLHGQPVMPLANKVAVMGMLQRGEDGTSKVRTMTVGSTKRHHLAAKLEQHVEEGSTIYTDSLRSYRNLNDYTHEFIDHATDYVRGNVHTNGMESYWSLLKRALHGTYISVEPFHLFRYLDEQAFRFNNRKLSDAARFVLAIAGIVGKRLTYAELIAAADAGTA
jgi:transposase-like protein